MARENTATPAGQLSFFARVKAELKRLFVRAPGWEASAAATLTYVAPMVEAVMALVDPAAAPLVSTCIERVQSALAAASVVIRDAGPAPTLASYLNAILADLTQVESAAQVHDPDTLAKMSALVTTITGEVNAILKELEPANA